MNKKFISIIGASAIAVCAMFGGIMFTGMHTKASGTQVTLSVESPTVEKDEEIKVIVSASSGEAMSYIQTKVTYNSQALELVETSSNLASGANGEIHIYETLAYGENERNYELTFKALEVGTTDVSVEEGTIELYESLEQVSISTSTLPIDVVVNTSSSEDARIREIMIAGVSDMTDVFDPNIYEYDIQVGKSMEMFIYSAIPMNEESVIAAPDDLMLDIGENYFEVHITAPAGNEQIYVFNVTRLDHELEPETETEVETETETEIETEVETAEETTVETEIETESVNETVSETEMPAETENEEVVVPTPIELEETDTSDTELLDAQAIEVVE